MIPILLHSIHAWLHGLCLESLRQHLCQSGHWLFRVSALDILRCVDNQICTT